MKCTLEFRNYFIGYFILLAGITQLSAQPIYYNWAKRMGGFSRDEGNSIAIDAFGNVYTTGRFMGPVDFDPGTDTLILTNGNEVFISKLDASGNFVWAKSMGGGSYDGGTSIAVDASGNVYTTGSFNGTADFDPGVGIFNLTSAGISDVFISKLNASGNFVWAKCIGGSSIDEGYSISVDASGNVYTTGRSLGTADFDPGPGTYILMAPGIFISKLDASGSFVWAKGVAGTSFEGKCIAADALGNVCTTGVFNGTGDFDPGAGIFNLTSNGGTEDIFVLKLDASGNFVWAKRMGGTSNGDLGYSIAVDAVGNIYTTGSFCGTADFDPGVGTFNLTADWSEKLFISKLDAAGNFVWAKGIGGAGQCFSYSIKVDVSGNVYTTGGFELTADFDPGAGTFYLTTNTNDISISNIFISKLDAAGNLVWAKSMGGENVYGNRGNSIAIDANGNVFTTGYFSGTADFDPDQDTFNLTSIFNNDIFVLKMGKTPLGIEENTSLNNIQIYPNPTSNQINIASNDISRFKCIKIVNPIGQVVIEKISESSGNMDIDLSDQLSGIYFVEIKLGENISRIKLFKQ